MKIQAAGRTDTGRKRGHNEDCFGVYDDAGLYVVADGMGGHAAGEVASGIAVDTLKAFIGSTSGADDVNWPYEPDPALGTAANRLVSGIKLANMAIRTEARMKPESSGMGTTMVAALADGDDLIIAHVGDSRAYVFDGARLVRLTVDHSFVEEMVANGSLTPEQARTHPMKNRITRALGSKDEVSVDVSIHGLGTDDVYLLCSDGLSGMLDDREIAETIGGNRDNMDACAEELVRLANEKGGLDNITVVVLRAA